MLIKNPSTSFASEEKSAMDEEEEEKDENSNAAALGETWEVERNSSGEDLAWLSGTGDHPFIGRRVRHILDASFGSIEGYWEEGQIIAYLPPDDEEPMALWKFKLTHRENEYMDLEENEIFEALKINYSPSPPTSFSSSSSQKSV